MIYVALFRGRSLVSRLIRWQTRSCYSHAALARFEDGQLVVLEAWHVGGVACGLVDERHTAGTQIDLFEAAGLDGSIAWDNARETLGQSYDWLGVLRFVSRRSHRRKARRWFCSEHVMVFARLAGANLLTGPAENVSPGMLARSPLLVLAREVVTG